MPVALEQFVKQLADSGVIAPGKLEKFIPPQAAPKDAQELAKELVRQKHLTKFQAQEIYLGRQKSLILGNYTIVDKIGAGGMGQVFKAEHRRMHRLVAIKMLPAATMKDAAAAARFQREVEAAAKLSHPNIVAAHDADEANGVHFLVMEYVEGSDLSALVKKNGPLPVAKAVSYVLQAARGLEFAHGEGVVHRDIKPANLLLDKKGTVKILDMGLARIDGSRDTATQAELTGTGAVLGTVDYMAPEQALSTKHVDGRADIYSLGCSLYYLLTAHAAYDGDSLMAKLLAHREQPIPALGADVTEDVQAVFQKMVAKKVQDRYQTMSDVVAALEQCSSDQPSSVSLPQSLSINLDAEELTFLRDASAHTSHIHKKTKKAVPAKNAKDKKKLILAAVGAGFLGLAILAAVIFRLRTNDGMLVVEVNQPDAVVQVLNEAGKVEVTQPAGKGAISISVDPGKHRIKVEKDGFQFFAQDFVMESGGKESIKATLEPISKNTTLRDPAFRQWMKDVGKLPADKQLESVAKKLQQLNPGFDGTVTPMIEKGIVTRLEFVTDNVTEISPIRALAGLRDLHCTGSGGGKGKLADLSPLQGMPLSSLELNDTQVSDLSPLNGMNLTMVLFTPKNITKGLDVIRQMKSLTNIGIGWGDKDQFPPDEFWKKYDAGQFGNLSSTVGTPDRRPITTKSDPALKQWIKEVAALPAEKQVEAVTKKLQELNPGFDRNETHKVEDSVVTELQFVTDNVTDISPVRALNGLKKLQCAGTGEGNGILSDLSPLGGMPLTQLICERTKVSDLSSLRGMPLTNLSCGRTQVSDLSPLKGMSLTELRCQVTTVSDLSPLKGMTLTTLFCDRTKVSDLSPLEGMPLADLRFWESPVSDLSPLKGMPLTYMEFNDTQVSDLSPLQGKNLTDVRLTPKNITKGMDVIRQMKSLNLIGLNKDSRLPPAEFWKKYDAGQFGNPSSTAGTPDRKPITSFKDPAFQQWMKTVATLPAEEQVEAVSKKLQELNPGFDGKETHEIENGVATELQFFADNVVDLSPVRSLAGLKRLICSGSGLGKGKLSDLSPLQAMPLTELNFHWTEVSDLSPLKGLRLTKLDFGGDPIFDLSPLQGMRLEKLTCCFSSVSDLSPLKGMKLTEMICDSTPVSDLLPLKGMPLTTLYCNNTKVSDLSPLTGMNLTIIFFTPKNITKGIDVIRQMKSLKTFALDWNTSRFSPAEFWRKYDAGEFGKPDSTGVNSDHKPITNINDPAFQQWMKTVAALPAEQQVQAVVKKLQELNPGFDGKVTGWKLGGQVDDGLPQIEDGVVTDFGFATENVVADISPVRALLGLKRLCCRGVNRINENPSDLSALRGMKLTCLDCSRLNVSDLTPLRGMPLEFLGCDTTNVADLSPLRGMPLSQLWCGSCPVSDLSPLQGMPLKVLACDRTHVTDLSPLQGMNIEKIFITSGEITQGMDALRQMKSLTVIGTTGGKQSPPAEFWKKYDAGEFNQ